MLRPAAVHKSQHHSSIAASRQRQNLVSLVSDSERYVHCTPQQVVKNGEFLGTQYEISLALFLTRKYPLRGYILGVLTHTTAWDQL